MTWILLLGKWISANKLSANLIKTEYMIIAMLAKLNILDYSPVIELNGKPIAHATETPSLGLIVDEALTWAPYVQHLSTEMASAISAIKQANFLPKNHWLLYINLQLNPGSDTVILFGETVARP